MALPPDNPSRHLTHANPDDPALPHVAVVGDTYTILVSSEDTAGQFALIDMHIPPGSGPPMHRHDFDEMFTVLDGEIEATFRGKKVVVIRGETINIPANAPHTFKNASKTPVRLHCLVSPGGQDEFFLAVGDRVATRTSPPRELSEAEQRRGWRRWRG